MLHQSSTINNKLRTKRLAAGLTESQLAEAVAKLVSAETGHAAALDGNYVSKLERGKITWPNSVYRRALRELFDAATDAELGFFATRTRRDAQRLLPASGVELTQLDTAAQPPTTPQRPDSVRAALVAEVLVSPVALTPGPGSATGASRIRPAATEQVTT